MKKKSDSGFTLIEVLIVTTVMIILTAVALPVSYSLLEKNDLNLTAQKIVQTARQAQVLAQANDSDSVWGIHAQSGSVTLFKGSSYAARNVARDKIYSFSNSENISGVTDFVFSKLTGYPATSGVLIITSPDTTVKNVTINARGMVQY